MAETICLWHRTRLSGRPAADLTVTVEDRTQLESMAARSQWSCPVSVDTARLEMELGA